MASKTYTLGISANKVAGVLKLLKLRLRKRGFFDAAASGVNCANGFIVFDDAGNPTLMPHSRLYRQRHVLPGQWRDTARPVEIPQTSLLWKLLNGCFPLLDNKGNVDPEAAALWKLIQCIAAAVVSGSGTTYTKAIILLGRVPGTVRRSYSKCCGGCCH